MTYISVIVPTYNERENIGELVKRLQATDPISIIIIDDDSPDGTADEAEGLARRYGNLKVIKRPGRFGLGSAVSDGMKEASGDLIAVMDADLQHPPEKIIDLSRSLEDGADIAIASRYVMGGGIEGWGAYRRIVSLGAKWIAHALLPETRGIEDPLSGFFAFNRKSVRDLKLSTQSFKVLLEFLHHARDSNLKIVEVPFVFIARKKGKSKLGVHEYVRYMALVLRLRKVS